MIYLHVGNNKSIREKEIIGIFDLDTSTVSSVTRKYLSVAEKKSKTESATDEIPKSFIIYKKDGEKSEKVCFSQFSSTSLFKRTENVV